ncbi:MAG: hypothetical protein KDB69_10805 [Acidimicrobiia bacterium]|nr:hypothetical protein [Acidimicrobiia bacterium]
MSDTDTAERTGFFGSSDRIELVATIVLAIATILTAWSAFQSTKWSGTQANNYSAAGAARTESTRFDTRAGQLTQIDVAMYTDWVAAYFEESADGTIPAVTDGTYQPTPGTTSGFLYTRFRPEFRPAVEAWLATDPVGNPDAPPTPFAMEEYVVADRLEAERLQTEADERAQAARDANQTSDNYVLTMVLFASVLFFAGVSSKLYLPRNRIIALGFGLVLLVVGSAISLSLPILV